MKLLIVSLFAAMACLTAAHPSTVRQVQPARARALAQAAANTHVSIDGATKRDTAFDSGMTRIEVIKLVARAMPGAVTVLLSDASEGEKMAGIANAFLPAARSIVEERAYKQGRSISEDDAERLQVAEELVPVLMHSMANVVDSINSNSDNFQ